jgi:hypothetical protein
MVQYNCPDCSKVFFDKDARDGHKRHVHGFSQEDYLEGIRSLAEQIGGVPTKQDMDDQGRFSHHAYDSNFESWNVALRKAGFEPNREYDTSRQKLLDDLRHLWEELDRVPRREDMSEKGPHSAAKYFHPEYGFFENWTEALKQAGIEPDFRYDVTEEKVLDDLRRIANEQGRTPTLRMVTEHGKYGAGTIQRLFDEKWVDVVRRAGLTPVQAGNGETDSFDYGEGWNHTKREAVRQRENYSCFDCGVSQEKFSKEFNREQSLSVHHVVKAANITEPQIRNSKDNLIALCEQCHNRWESANGLCPEDTELPPYIRPPDDAA